MAAAENNSAKDVQRVQCVWDVLSILLFSCWIDLRAHTKHRAVPALRELIVLRFPRWKNGSVKWMGMQKKSLRDSSHESEQQMGEKITTASVYCMQQLSTYRLWVCWWSVTVLMWLMKDVHWHRVQITTKRSAAPLEIFYGMKTGKYPENKG